jgi:WD40 repeat protein
MITVWDLQTEKSFSFWAGDAEKVACSSHGSTAFVQMGGGTGSISSIQIYNLQGIEERPPVKGHIASVQRVAISPDGKTALSCAETVKLWDLQTGKELFCFPEKESGEIAEGGWVAGFSDEGNTIMAVTSIYGQQLCYLWDIKTRKELFQRKYDYECNILNISPMQKTLLVGIDLKTAILLDVQTGKELLTLKSRGQEFAEGFQKGIFSSDGKICLIQDGHGLRLWDLQDGKIICSLPKDGKQALGLSPRGAIVIESDCLIKLVTSSTGEGRSLDYAGFEGVWDVAFSPDETMIVWGKGKTAKLLDLKSKDEPFYLEHPDQVCSVAFSPDGKMVVTGGADCSIKAWALFDRGGALQPRLIWSSNSPSLQCDGLNLEGIQGLDSSNHRLLMQYGAKDKAS